MRTATQYPLAVLADGDVVGFARNARELEAASDSAGRYPGVKVTTRPVDDAEAARLADLEIEDDEDDFERRYAGEHDYDYVGRP